MKSPLEEDYLKYPWVTLNDSIYLPNSISVEMYPSIADQSVYCVISNNFGISGITRREKNFGM
jgi:hypothetical protein